MPQVFLLTEEIDRQCKTVHSVLDFAVGWTNRTSDAPENQEIEMYSCRCGCNMALFARGLRASYCCAGVNV